jgi:2-polyprenyl-3-methyl-5-hydroxy-6-metoxy-1,4-benzoquinol methylase
MRVNRQYRYELYQNYSTVQKPEWNQANAKADAVWSRAALSRLRGWLPHDEKIKCLDLGCGSGLLLETLRDAGYSDVRGVDLGPQGVGMARMKGFRVAQADLRDFLRESSESFDLITAFDVIEHLERDELLDLLPIIYSHLTPGGRFIIQTPNAFSPWAASSRYGDLTHEWIFTPHSITSVLQLMGFTEVRSREVTPYVHGAFSAVRWVLWKLIWTGCYVWNLAESGSDHGGIYTRNLMVIAVRPLEP